MAGSSRMVLAFAGFVCVGISAAAATAGSLGRQVGDTPEARRATRALNLLEAQGFCAGLESKSANAFEQFGPQGAGFVARVNQSGRVFEVTVDPDSGRVSRIQ